MAWHATVFFFSLSLSASSFWLHKAAVPKTGTAFLLLFPFFSFGVFLFLSRFRVEEQLTVLLYSCTTYCTSSFSFGESIHWVVWTAFFFLLGHMICWFVVPAGTTVRSGWCQHRVCFFLEGEQQQHGCSRGLASEQARFSFGVRWYR